MAKIHGISKIEIGATGADGAPGTSLTEVTAIEMESVSLTVPEVEGEAIYVEEIDTIYDELDNTDPDPVQVNFSTYKADNAALNTIFGGTLTDGKYTPNRNGVERTMVITTKSRSGTLKKITFPRLLLRMSIDSPLTKGALTAVTGTGTALTPFNASNQPLADWYMEDVLTPVGDATSIDVTPTAPSIAVAGTQQLTVTATYSNTATDDVTATSTYESATPGVATVDANGLVTGVSAGSSVITATHNGLTDTSTVTVS